MHRDRLGFRQLVIGLISICVVFAFPLFPQPAPATQAAIPSLSAKDSLLISMGPSRPDVTFTLVEFKALPHTTITVHNSHSNADETYSGVLLADLLGKLGAPLGKDLRGPALAAYVVATGLDGYKAVLALAEVDPSFHSGDVIVADAMDGKALDAHSGPFKLVVSEDKRPARSVRNLVSLRVKSAE